jgi:hypothetical protein
MMNKYVAVENITEELSVRRLAGITLWNRLEARPRTDNFDRALKAEVRDALWMLTKQWQLGEFLGDDAGSPAFSKMYLGKTKLTKYVPGSNAVQTFDETVPLEAKVEKRKIPFAAGASVLSLDIRLLMGRQWLKLISSFGSSVADDYILKYKIALPDADRKADAMLTAHKETWEQFTAVAGRCMDGALLYFYLKEDNTRHAYDGIGSLSAGQFNDIDTKAAKFLVWFEKLFYQPQAGEGDAWNPMQLEYQFACSAPNEGSEKVLVADEYYHGHMDWYNLDIDPRNQPLDETGIPTPAGIEDALKLSFMPVPLSFDGMPNTRWWTFEDGRTNFGNINPSTTDLGKLLFIEFALNYSNDWFLLPVTMPAGSIATVKGLSVTNVFGERLWIEASGAGGLDDAWNKWSMFTLNTRGNRDEATDNSLLVLPTVSKILEGKPVEEVRLIRDEMANMVWGIEHIIPLATGIGKRGNEAAAELKSRYQQLIDKAVKDGTIIPVVKNYKADISYNVMNSVPENWIPFIPVKIEKNKRSIRLQRAAMPRILNRDTENPAKVEPRTVLLREGLDIQPKSTYFINEEEVTRAGTDVYHSYQRTRWYNGKVITWLGARKQTGRGEGSSQLAFDQSVNVTK